MDILDVGLSMHREWRGTKRHRISKGLLHESAGSHKAYSVKPLCTQHTQAHESWEQRQVATGTGLLGTETVNPWLSLVGI